MLKFEHCWIRQKEWMKDACLGTKSVVSLKTAPCLQWKNWKWSYLPKLFPILFSFRSLKSEFVLFVFIRIKKTASLPMSDICYYPTAFMPEWCYFQVNNLFHTCVLLSNAPIPCCHWHTNSVKEILEFI